MLIVLSLLVVTVFGNSGRLLKPMSQDMIDFINNEAQTTWKVSVGFVCNCYHLCMGFLLAHC